MCGRFSLAVPEAALRDLIGPADWAVPQTMRWNIAPGQDVLTLTAASDCAGDRLRVAPVRWGHEIAGRAAPLVNIRSEGLIGGRFGAALRDGRCILPADAFYEWRGRGGQPYRIHLPDEEVFGLAALRAPDGGFAVLTREAVPALAGIHPRMPVVLEPEVWRSWLCACDAPDAVALLEREPPPLEHHPVSRHVNAVTNDDPDCALPVEPEPVQTTLW